MMPKGVCEFEYRLPKTVNHFVHGKVFLEVENRPSPASDKIKAFEAFEEVKKIVKKNKYPKQKLLDLILRDGEACLYYIRLVVEVGRQIPKDMEAKILEDSRLSSYYVALLKSRLGGIIKKVRAIAKVGEPKLDLNKPEEKEVRKGRSTGNYVTFRGNCRVNLTHKSRILEVLKKGGKYTGPGLVKKVYADYGDEMKIHPSDVSRCVSMLKEEGYNVEAGPYRYVDLVKL